MRLVNTENPAVRRAAKRKQTAKSKKLEQARPGVKNKLYNLLPTCPRKGTSSPNSTSVKRVHQ